MVLGDGDSDMEIRNRLLPNSGSQSSKQKAESRVHSADHDPEDADHSPESIVFDFDSTGQSIEAITEHFWFASSFFPGHGTVRKKKDILHSIETFKDVEDLMSIPSMIALDDNAIQTYTGAIENKKARHVMQELIRLAFKTLEAVNEGSFGKKHSTQPSKNEDTIQALTTVMSKLVKRKRSKSGDSEDSESGETRKTLPVKLKSCAINLIKPENFANSKAMKALIRDLKSFKVCDQDVDTFIPEYVGRGLPISAKKEAKSSRIQDNSRKPIAFLETILTFWTSHVVGEVVTFESVVAHMLILFQLVSTHSVQHAFQYERFFISKLSDESKYDNTIDIPTKLATIDDTILTKCNALYGPPIQSSTKKSSANPNSTNNNSTNKRKSRTDSDDSPPAPNKKKNHSNLKDEKHSRSSKGKADSSKNIQHSIQSYPKIPKPRVCFNHDPRAGKTCRFGDKCRDIHLNTTRDDQFRRFKDAKQSADAKRIRSQ